VVARRAILSAAVHALCEIEGHGAAATPELPSKVPIAELNPLHAWLKLLQNLQNDVINAEHVAFLQTR